jgi:hypothetical protein
LQTFWREGRFYLDARRLHQRWTNCGGSRPDAISAQQFCSNGAQQKLIGADGISKTVMWKNCDVEEVRRMRELRRCENVPD